MKKFFRNKWEVIGVIMGAVCFIPSFAAFKAMIGFGRPVAAFVVLLASQALWLTSIAICIYSVTIENDKLKKQLKDITENPPVVCPKCRANDIFTATLMGYKSNPYSKKYLCMKCSHNFE